MEKRIIRYSRIKKQKQKLWLHVWRTQAKSLFYLIRLKNKLLYEANLKSTIQIDENGSNYKKELEKINIVKGLINENVSSILNKLLVFTFLIIIFGIVWLFSKQSSTPIRLDLKVSALKMVIDTTNENTRRFNYYLEFDKVNQTLMLNTAFYKENDFKKDGEHKISFTLLDDSKIKLEHLKFPKNSTIELSNDLSNTVKLETYFENNFKSVNSLLSFDISFWNAEVYDLTLNKIDTFRTNKDQKSISGKIEKDISNGEKYSIEIPKPLPWEWPSGLHIKSIEFQETGPMGQDPISSVIYGKVNILETNDSALILNERDLLLSEFSQPVEIFLKGDSSGIYVHLEGEVSKIIFGPRILKNSNNHMPTQIKTISDKASYIWIILTVVISIITIIKIRA